MPFSALTVDTNSCALTPDASSMVSAMLKAAAGVCRVILFSIANFQVGCSQNFRLVEQIR
jgi:hypothetical protein